MNYSTLQLTQIKEYAACLTPITDIAVLMGLDIRQFREDIRDVSSAASLAYRRGKAETALAIRKNEITLADAGSPLAVQLMNSYLQNMETEEDF